jgi:hypothetical protein
MFSCASLFAQGFKVGAGVALPVGDLSDVSDLGLNVEATYLWEASEKFDLGVMSGYFNYFGKEVDFGEFFGTQSFDDFGYLPIAFATRFNASEKFSLGLDLGAAIGISPDGIDSGFYYAPKALYKLTESLGLVLAFRGISTEFVNLNALSLGVEFVL